MGHRAFGTVHLPWPGPCKVALIECARRTLVACRVDERPTRRIRQVAWRQGRTCPYPARTQH